MSFGGWLQERWYRRRLVPALWLLAPLSLLFRLVSALRRFAYRCGWLPVLRLPVPVVVVGNLTAGGAGKTPLVLWLAGALQRAGWRPGIVSRGYGAAEPGPFAVTPDAAPARVGDEPLLLARRSGLPVWIGRDRGAAAQALLARHPEVNLLLCDDGLQHYRLARDVEIAVFDGRGAGNGWPLPLGPLREPLDRLRRVHALVFNGAPDHRVLKAAPHLPDFAMSLEPGEFYRLDDPTQRCTAAQLAGRRLHAVAGIGDPARFFRTLAQLGLEFTPHPFPDHYAYKADDLRFAEGEVVLMTEKDGVKCASFDLGEAWVLPVEARLPPELIHVLLETLNGPKAP
ncbi:tetraacyldisaccharide 4'-kinase [Azovibrio restrictus]|uniref:tetraacyldisaccharide 4'-kinase n=1 Tax=Azovibrio restrictus TaxID=146938 RepID=UPI0026F3621B|nr:tetraacyldisaccharide 4'-kinase [Azovibrio restrictus]